MVANANLFILLLTYRISYIKFMLCETRISERTVLSLPIRILRDSDSFVHI